MNWGPAGASTAMLRADQAHTVGLCDPKETFGCNASL